MSRNLRRATPLLIAFVVLAAGCGEDDDDATAASAPPAVSALTPTTATSVDAAFPVSVEHALGTTVVEEEPTRVVTVGVTEQDTVLALGVTPVGVTDWYGDQPYATWPWAQDELGDATPTVLSTSDGFEFERIAALEPDLIIGTNAGIDEESYATLSAIAPTIAHPAGAALYFSPWDDQARLIGQALGKEAEMEAIIGDIDDQFAAAAAAHPEFAGQQVIFLQNAIYDGRAIAYQEGLSTEFLTDLGFGVPAELDEFATEGQAYIPLEQLDVLDTADVLVWGTEAPTDRAALEQEPLYLGLEEVRDGRLVFTDGVTAGAIYFTSPLSLPFVLEQLVPALASTIAGDGPATIDAAAVTEPADSSAGEATDQFPLTIEHAYGTTDIPAAPERIVTVGYNDQDPVLALGVVPVGVMPWYQDQPLGFEWTIEAYGDAVPEQVGGGEFLEINFEKVAALQPDLIIGASGMRSVDYEVASRIAPTIPQEPGESDYSSAPWQDTQRYIGRALGRSAQADAVVAEVEAAIDAARAAHPEFEGARAVVAQVDTGQFAVRGSAEIWSEFLTDMGFTVPADIVGPEYTEISPERVELFGDLDALVWLATPEDIAVSPLYAGLPVATAGRDVYVDAFGPLSGAIGFNSALSLPIVVDQLVPKLAAAVDGDASTPVPD